MDANTVHLHAAFQVNVFLNTQAPETGPYEAQVTHVSGDGDQYRGYGQSPKAAIMAALDGIGK